jgi:hypothetical protein
MTASDKSTELSRRGTIVQLSQKSIAYWRNVLRPRAPLTQLCVTCIGLFGHSAHAATPTISKNDVVILSDGSDLSNARLWRVDNAGNMLWDRALPFPVSVCGWSNAFDRNYTEDAVYLIPNCRRDPTLTKFDANGELSWEIPLYGPFCNSVSADPIHGGTYVGCDSAGVVKFDEHGHPVWGPTMFGLQNAAISPDWVVAADYVNGGTFAVLRSAQKVLKIDASGNIVWQVAIPSVTSRIDAAPDGGVYVSSTGYSSDLYKLSDSGAIEWTKSAWPSPYNYGRVVSPVDGSIIVVSGWPFRIAKASVEGVTVWNMSNEIGIGTSLSVDWGMLAIDPEDNGFYANTYAIASRSISKFDANRNRIWEINNGSVGTEFRSYPVTGHPAKALPNSPPAAAPGGGGNYEYGLPVTLYGQVSDIDGDLVAYQWSEGTEVVHSGTIQTVRQGSPVDLPTYTLTNLAIGVHVLVLTVDDGVNNLVATEVMVTIADNEAPTLAPIADKTILWPPNHSMVPVTIDANALDNSGLPIALGVEVKSNEPEIGLGYDDVPVDWIVGEVDPATGRISLQLRAERSGAGSGREYSVVISATDAIGNVGTSTVKIIVPHDRGKK